MTTKTRALSPVACRGILQRSQKNEKEMPADLLEVLEKRAGANLNAGGLSIHSWTDYNHICGCLIETFGRDRLLTDLLPDDFERLRSDWSEKWGPVRLGNKINLVRIVFRYAYKNRLIPAEIVFGEGFKRPSKKELRVARAKKGLQMFESAELRRIIKAATQPMKAMIWLAINCGLGNNDVALLPTSALNLETGWLTYPRPKTGIMRKCWLWPETAQAIREWLAKRPEANKPEDAGLVFITAKGGSWAKETTDNPISKETRKLLDRLGINGRNFYTLRHIFETIAGESRDQVAVDAIMGHVDGSMAATYRERISDERLQAVADLVRGWLFAEPVQESQEKPRLKIAPEQEAAASA
jgi:integrase